MRHTTRVKADTHPALPDGEWTKVSEVPSGRRRGITIINESSSVTVRHSRVPAGDAAPTAATEGAPLAPGERYQEHLVISQADHYIYQSSGSEISAVFVQEEV